MRFHEFVPAFLFLTTKALADLTPIKAKGSKFFVGDGPQFFVKAVTYLHDDPNKEDVGPVDSLADAKGCERDVPLLKELGVNTIRSYFIDPSADHSACMKLLQDAGIYVIASLTKPGEDLGENLVPKWHAEMFSYYKSVVDALSPYPNVIGLFAGNDVTTNVFNTHASAIVKAAVRDIKTYIKEHPNIKRWLGVGYATYHHSRLWKNITTYFNCGPEEESVDFWAYNIYTWCQDPADNTPYKEFTEYFQGSPVPVIAASSCSYAENNPLAFRQTKALYEEPMSGVFSGGVLHNYFDAGRLGGLVEIEDGKANKTDTFVELKEHIAKFEPKGVSMNEYTPLVNRKECPAISSAWSAEASPPPTPDGAACDCMVKSLSCAVKPKLEDPERTGLLLEICLPDNSTCSDISWGPSEGYYGRYSMCDQDASLSFAADQYYKKHNNTASFCHWGGSASLQRPEEDEKCKAILANNEAKTKAAKAAAKRNASNSLSATQPFFAGQSILRLYAGALLCAGAARLLI